jgi:hypothetical protein
MQFSHTFLNFSFAVTFSHLYGVLAILLIIDFNPSVNKFTSEVVFSAVPKK